MNTRHTLVPNRATHRHDKEYVSELVTRTGLSVRKIEELIDVGERTLRYYLSGQQKMPYTVQFSLEALAENARQANAVHESAGEYVVDRFRTHWSTPAQRPITASDFGKIIVGRDRFGAPIYGELAKDGFGIYIAAADGIDVHRTPVANVALYTLLDPPPKE